MSEPHAYWLRGTGSGLVFGAALSDGPLWLKLTGLGILIAGFLFSFPRLAKK